MPNFQYKALDTDGQAVTGQIERGGIDNPKIATVIKLANAFGISLDELVGRKKQ